MRPRSIITSIVLLVLTTSAVGCAVVCDQYVADYPEVFPTRDVVVAARTIEPGTDIDSDMVAVRTVPVDETSEMGLSDPTQALGEVAAIDILPNQIIMPNMLLDFPYTLPPDPDADLIEVAVEEVGEEE